MSLRTTGHQPTYPETTATTIDIAGITDTATTTLASTTTNHSSTTTTTTVGSTTATSTISTTNAATSSALATSPRMVGRTTGSHANTLGLDWAVPDDRASYLAKTGLHPLHAAIINDDWALAATMLSAENIGMPWQFDPRYGSEWQKDLRSNDKQKQKLAIIDMAFALVEASTIEGANCLHGISPLTLCLKKHAPAEFLQQLIATIKKHAPHYLDQPDSSGRTPLYVAAEQGDKEQVKMLMAHGADPLAKCNFQQTVDPCDMPTAHHAAVINGHEDIFQILLEKSIAGPDWKTRFQSGDDALCIFKWTSRHNRDDVLALARRFPDLEPILLNADDQSGTSEIYRCIKNGDWPNTHFHPLGRSQLEKKPIFVAASFGHADIFFRMISLCMATHSFEMGTADKRRLIATFLHNASVEQIVQLPDHWPGAKRLLCETVSTREFLNSISADFERYSTIARMAWPLMTHAEQNNLFLDTSNREARHLVLVMGLDSHRVKYYPWDIFSIIAASNHKTELYEIAETYSLTAATAISRLASDKSSPIPRARITQILQARSTRLFEAFLQAGLRVQDLLDIDNDHFLPLMADCNPTRLRAWLADCQFTVSADAIANLRTDAGFAALEALSNADETASADNETENAHT